MIRFLAICFTLLLGAQLVYIPTGHAQGSSEDFYLVYDSFGSGVHGCTDDFQVRGIEDNAGGRCDGVVEEEEPPAEPEEEDSDDGGSSGSDNVETPNENSAPDTGGGGGGRRSNGDSGGESGGTNVAVADPIYVELGEEVVDAALYQQAAGIYITPKGEEVPLVREEEKMEEPIVTPTPVEPTPLPRSQTIITDLFPIPSLTASVTNKNQVENAAIDPFLNVAYIALSVMLLALLVIHRLTRNRSVSSPPQKKKRKKV